MKNLILISSMVLFLSACTFGGDQKAAEIVVQKPQVATGMGVSGMDVYPPYAGVSYVNYQPVVHPVDVSAYYDYNVPAYNVNGGWDYAPYTAIAQSNVPVPAFIGREIMADTQMMQAPTYAVFPGGAYTPVQYQQQAAGYNQAFVEMATQEQVKMTQKTALANVPDPDKEVTIVLQHPRNRDLVKCSSADTACLNAYESQGYIRLRNMPKFAGHKDVTSESDYPPKQWRDNNNIPRW
ncbi:MAG: hypothetical protein LBU87_01675 [Lactobacillales bacterium]|jgi:hypothetical protein|nr:hypothetical protein [Lactobacillales bacterium]